MECYICFAFAMSKEKETKQHAQMHPWELSWQQDLLPILNFGLLDYANHSHAAKHETLMKTQKTSAVLQHNDQLSPEEK